MKLIRKITEFPITTQDPFSYFAGIISGRWKITPADLSSIENNLIVINILDAAKESAKKGKMVRLK